MITHAWAKTGGGLWLPSPGRTERFHLDPDFSLSTGLRLFLGGNQPRTLYAYDSAGDFGGGNDGGRRGLLTGMNPETDSGWVDDIKCYAQSFDGLTKTIPLASSINLGTEYSYHEWSYATGQDDCHFGGSFTPKQHYTLYHVHLTDTQNYVYHQAGGAYTNWSDGKYMIGNRWVCWGIRRIGTSVDLFRDGAYLATGTLGSNNDLVVQTLGGFASGTTAYRFAGKMADVAAWSRPLTDSEFQLLATRDPYYGGWIVPDVAPCVVSFAGVMTNRRRRLLFACGA